MLLIQVISIHYVLKNKRKNNKKKNENENEHSHTNKVSRIDYEILTKLKEEIEAKGS